MFFLNSFSLLITKGEMLQSVKGYCMEVYFNSKMKQIEYPSHGRSVTDIIRIFPKVDHSQNDARIVLE